jgi:hypothetical protein
MQTTVIPSFAKGGKMSHVRMAALPMVFGVFVIFCTGCRQDAQDTKPRDTSEEKADVPAGKPFLDKKKRIPAGLEWNTNVTSKNGGKFTFRVESQGPFAVTVVTEAGYQAVKNKDKNVKKSDILFTVDSKENTYEGKVTVPPGTSWFIIENQANKEVEFRLQCLAP